MLEDTSDSPHSAEYDAVTCSDGVVRHTRFVVMDCAVCRPESHTDCGCRARFTRPGETGSADERPGGDA